MDNRDNITESGNLRGDPHATEVGFADWRCCQPGQADSVISSRLLFGDTGKLVMIEHEGERYRLQITRAGKLLLTK